MRINELLIADMAYQCRIHNHEIQSKHISVVVRNGHPVCAYKFNHTQHNLTGLSSSKTAHAEMAAVNELYKHCRKNAGLGNTMINISSYSKGTINRLAKVHV